MVRIDKPYAFAGPGGPARLVDLFAGRRQLIVYHFMFDPGWKEGCPSCSLLIDNVGHVAHLHARDTSLALVSRAPLDRIEPFQRRMGWTLPWYSSHGSDFNYDFDVSHDESVAPVRYNYLDKAELVQKGEELFRHRRVAWDQRLPARRRRRISHVLVVRARLRPAGGDVQPAGPDRARTPGGLGGAAGPQRRPVHVLGSPPRSIRIRRQRFVPCGERHALELYW